MRPTHQATARTTLVPPMGVPSSSPRSVSMTGVKGWYSANQRIPAGHRVRADKRAAGERQQLEDEGEAVGARRRFAHQAEHDPHPRDRQGKQRDDAERRDPGDRIRRWAGSP